MGSDGVAHHPPRARAERRPAGSTGGITIQSAPLGHRSLLDADDTARALGAASARLQRQFRGEVDPGMIEMLVTETYVELARTARITQYLPLLAERSVRRGLRSRRDPEG